MKRHGYVVRIAPGRWGSFDQTGRLVRVFPFWYEAYSHAFAFTTGKSLYRELRDLDAWYAARRAESTPTPDDPADGRHSE